MTNWCLRGSIGRDEKTSTLVAIHLDYGDRWPDRIHRVGDRHRSIGFVDRAQRADVIVLLGSQVFPGGRLGPSLERRAQHAAALYKRGLADHILCSGGVGDNPPAEAIVACGRVIALGVPKEAILYEDRSHSTEENAAYSTAIMREHGWQSAIIDTDGFHMLRAAWMFERAGVIAYPSPAQITAGPMNPVERLVREMREALGVAWYGGKVVLGIDLTRQ